MSNITDKLAEALRAFNALITHREHTLGGLSDEMQQVASKARAALAEYEKQTITMFGMAKALHERGLYIGLRDPQRNTDFPGEFMICENVNEPVPARDAGRGGFCIVGDDLHDLIRDAYSHMFD